ncbi:kalirin [Musca domestica]|uniref:Kalirin n=2 Tax=Musca domestica TaxID=7370 RepID=A0ABM3VKS8_MUSDO|nr:kalirin [Musca domestica]XP_058986415.1 kalirin [Musca domestica]XP_058986416.1 kalirin [Musca domestica]XP_058986417.1 kalirin [Musca domestica]XP_058986418.1 kalirin [Musca domestica]XP_058986419.1 kalirin [Musca domestica]XP_058986420.1 kalirin [Musca domestica]
MSDIDSPRPFRRERNLSNRNFNKRGSNRRRQSTESHSSIEPRLLHEISIEDNTSENSSQPATPSTATTTSTSSSSLNMVYSVNSDATESSANHKPSKPMRKLRSYEFTTSLEATNTSPLEGDSPEMPTPENQHHSSAATTPVTPDPAWLGVQQKRILFEKFHASDNLKTSKFNSKSTQSLLSSERAQPVWHKVSAPTLNSSSTSSNSGSYYVAPPGRVLVMNLDSQNIKHHSSFHHSIDEEHTEDEVDAIEDEVAEECPAGDGSENRKSLQENSPPIAEATNKTFLAPFLTHSNSHEPSGSKVEEEEASVQKNNTNKSDEVLVKEKTKDFPRNYRSRPLTEIGGSQTVRLRGEKYTSLRQVICDPEDEEQIEMRDKGYGCIQPILDELIKTEETYVENLWMGINNYGNMFERKDLPMGLRGKKYVLFGNVEQLAEFHRDEFLPMLHRNKHDLKRLFDEFQQYIEQHCFYGYVLYTMNKQRSLKLCDTYKNYFKLIQTELDDKLGINSFLVQPIQRMARYPLLLTQFITTLFKNRDYIMKPVIESCCRLEKRLRTLLTTTNESEVINDIVCLSETHEFNTFYQGKFRKVSEFNIADHTLKRTYRGKVFIFDKCIIYTEIKGKQLIFHGRYPCEHIGITAKTKQFTLYYEHRKKQECDFMADAALVEQWLDLIREMVSSYAEEERKKFKEMRALEHGEDHMHPKPANLSLFRDSNRFSTDSGIGNMWILPKPETDESSSSRATWYATT